jgi:hypothetical protein
MPWREILDRTSLGQGDIFLEGVLPKDIGVVQPSERDTPSKKLLELTGLKKYIYPDTV